MKPRTPYPQGRTKEQEGARSRACAFDRKWTGKEVDPIAFKTHKERVEWMKAVQKYK